MMDFIYLGIALSCSALSIWFIQFCFKLMEEKL